MTHTSLLVALQERLSPELRDLLLAVQRAAGEVETPLWVVGGAVRDLLLPDRAILSEIDLAVGADLAVGIRATGGEELASGVAGIAEAVSGRTGAKIHRHDIFGTASLELGGVRIDMARSRRERYPRPGALPIVAAASIDDDLARRDFTINAMAFALGGPEAGRLLDPCGGAHDLERGLLRILHDGSFRDDPTRLVRGCRYAARIDGRFAPGTSRAAQRDTHYITSLSASRFGDAWRLLVSDRAASGALQRAHRLRLASGWLPGWRLSSAVRQIYDPGSAAAWELPAAELYWALSGLSTLDRNILTALPQRCALTRNEQRALEGGVVLRGRRSALGRRGARTSRLVASLRDIPPAALAAAYASWTGVAGNRVEAFLDTWRYVESPLDAASLARIGVEPGRAVGRTLERLRDQVLDGTLAPGDSVSAERWLHSRRERTAAESVD